MQKILLKNRIRWYVPSIIAAAAITLVLGILGGFNYARYFVRPVNIMSAPLREGTYVRTTFNEVIATYAMYGLESDYESDAEAYKYRYFVIPVGESLVGLRLSKSQVEKYSYSDKEIVGTLVKSEDDIQALLREWAISGYWTDKNQLEIGRLTPNVTFYAGYKGKLPAAAGFILFLFTVIFAAGTIFLIIRFIMSLRKRYDEGGQVLSNTLIITPTSVIIPAPFREHELKRKEITKIFPRSKRLEGGKLKWSLVFTVGGTEYISWLGTEEAAKAALEGINAK